MTYAQSVINSYKEKGIALQVDTFCTNNCEYATFKEFEKVDKFIGKAVGSCPWCKSTVHLRKYHKRK